MSMHDVDRPEEDSANLETTDSMALREHPSNNIAKLAALLSLENDGEEIAGILNEFLIDSKKTQILKARLHWLREKITYEQEPKLSKAERVMKKIVLAADEPLTVDQTSKLAAKEIKSLKQKTHASATLNSLVKKGVIAKIQQGKTNKFTDTTTAIEDYRSKISSQNIAENSSFASYADVAQGTGIPIEKVVEINLKDYLVQEFYDWLNKEYPEEANLLTWQAKMVEELFSQPVGSGKTHLLHYMTEFDRARGNRT